MANITSYLQSILKNQKQLQEATRSNSVNIARMHSELTTSMGSIKALLHVLNLRIENNVISPSMSRHYETRHKSPPGHTRLEEGDISGTEGVHKECLQEHLEYIVKELMIDGTTFIDELQEDSCLTEGEASDIRYQRDYKTKIRKLIYAIYTRDKATFSKFMKRLQRDNTHVHEKLHQAYSTKLTVGPRSSECLICVIKRDVDLRRVADKLCSHFIIDMEYLSTVMSFSDHNLPKVRKEFWGYVFSQIDKSSDRAEKLLQLRNALSDSKYKGLAEQLERWKRPKMTCHCNRISSLAFQANLSDSFSTGTSIGDLSTTSNIRSKSRVSLQSVSSLEEDVHIGSPTLGGNMPYTVAWVNNSPATNFESEPWSYPDSENKIPFSSQTVLTTVNSVNDRTENASLPSLTSNTNELNEQSGGGDRHQESSRPFPTRLNTVKQDIIYPQDISTDEVESLLKPPQLELNIEVANKLINKELEMMVTPLPVVDAYTGRKKVYKKKRHTRTRSDESSKISLEHDLLRIGEQDRLRLLNGLVDTPESGISEIFYSNINRIRQKDITDTSVKSETWDETCDVSSTDNRIPEIPTPKHSQVLAQTPIDKTKATVYPETVCRSDRNNNPQTDLIVLTPSRHLDPLSSGLGTRNDSTSSTKKRSKKEKNRMRNQSSRLRFDTY